MPRVSKEHFGAMHVYFKLLAEALNDGGFDVKTFIELSNGEFKLPWNKDSIKDLWKLVQLAHTGKKSTTQVSPYEAIQIYQIFGQQVAEITGVSIQWPSKEPVYDKRLYREVE